MQDRAAWMEAMGLVDWRARAGHAAEASAAPPATAAATIASPPQAADWETVAEIGRAHV